LGATNDGDLAQMLAGAHTGTEGFGGRTTQLVVGDARVFCKLIPLTRLESLPANFRSTRNLFDLPSYYQYGIGSVGFGAWRELASHALASDWVVHGKHEQFPLMHHWRVVEFNGSTVVDSEADDYLTHPAARGHDETSIRERLMALRGATRQIAVFTEHFPKTLSEWMLENLQEDNSSARNAILFVEERSSQAFEFMRSSNFVHFDAHFENVLTDGTRLYFADFGLAVDKSFELSAQERKFLSDHADYDAARFASSLVHTLCREIPGVKGWQQKLAEPDRYAHSLPLAAVAALQRYAPMAKYMAIFAQALKNTNRHTTFTPSRAFGSPASETQPLQQRRNEA
jgi:hypothetical protein